MILFQRIGEKYAVTLFHHVFKSCIAQQQVQL